MPEPLFSGVRKLMTTMVTVSVAATLTAIVHASDILVLSDATWAYDPRA
jgi:hypothetical protein